MRTKKVLYISHGHPDIIAGGAEQYAIELYQGMKNYGGFEPFLLARNSDPARRKLGTAFTTINSDPNQTLISIDNYDYFIHSTPNKNYFYGTFFRNYLETIAPDVIHFQHSLHLGFDLIHMIRKALGEIPIVYTLHEMIPICFNNGQMIRKHDNGLCYKSDFYECHKCFPHITSDRFFLREKFIKAHLDQVDFFLSPSQFLIDRFTNWGISKDKIQFEEYGRLIRTQTGIESNIRPNKRKVKLGFFGQITPHKGCLELLRCMSLLKEVNVELSIHGANLEIQSPEFQSEFNKLLNENNSNVRYAGPYKNEHLPQLMANVDWVIVPSTWWENSPLVIQEAFINKKPVICSNIGGMAEKVRHGVNGLHFQVGSHTDMADVITYAVETPELRDQLIKNIPVIYSIKDSVAVHQNLYQRLILQKQPSSIFAEPLN